VRRTGKVKHQERKSTKERGGSKARGHVKKKEVREISHFPKISLGQTGRKGEPKTQPKAKGKGGRRQTGGARTNACPWTSGKQTQKEKEYRSKNLEQDF